MAEGLAVEISSGEMKKARNRTLDAYLKHSAAVKGYIRKRVESLEDAEDILQNVFQNLARLEEDEEPIGSVSAWLYRVATNQIIDFRRKKREERMLQVASWEDGELSMRDLTFFLMDQGGDPETAMVRSAVWVELEEALAELPPEQRTVFELNELQDFSFKEIAESTGIPVNTLISRKRYAVLHLRRRLSELYGDINGKSRLMAGSSRFETVLIPAVKRIPYSRVFLWPGRSPRPCSCGCRT
ncbi:MAG: RNA polymerase sigma factor [Alistipes sp.]|nr:RNA polymerase sigma factor [Alistipes sp.]